MNKKRIVIAILCVVVIGAIICIFVKTNSKREQRKTENFQTITKSGYNGNIQEWLENNSITDNYKEAVKEGYEDSVYKWIKEITGNDVYDIAVNNNFYFKKVKWSIDSEDDNPVIVDAKFNNNNEIIVVLDNGKELNIGDVAPKNDEQIIIPDADKPIVYVESKDINLEDKKLVVPVAIKNNPGILGMTLTLEYDDRIFSLINVKNGEVFEKNLNMTSSKVLKSGCKFVWDGLEVTSNDKKDGEILLLEFDISDSAEEGVYSMKVSYDEGDIIDNELNSIDLLIENGNIIISK